MMMTVNCLRFDEDQRGEPTARHVLRMDLRRLPSLVLATPQASQMRLPLVRQSRGGFCLGFL
jgi:hypothetical protein